MKLYSLAIATAIAAGTALTAQAADQFVSIGTGGVTGVYYPTGGAICRLVNKKTQGARNSLCGRVYWRISLQY